MVVVKIEKPYNKAGTKKGRHINKKNFHPTHILSNAIMGPIKPTARPNNGINGEDIKINIPNNQKT